MPLAALASVFMTNSAVANINSTEPEILPTSINSQSDKVVAKSSEVFKFILKTPSQSQLMAYHSSHASHSSHSSHSSHQSGY